MSLDYTLDALVHFSRQLESVNETLRSSHRELRERHDAVDGLWRDAARATYDRAMEELDGRVGAYLGGESERFEIFLREKIRQLDAYLQGA